MVLDRQVERHLHLGPRSEGRFETVDAVTDLLVPGVQDAAGGLERADGHVRVEVQVQTIERRAGLVLERVAAADGDRPGLGVDVDVDVDVGHPRLRQTHVPAIFLLVRRLAVVARLGGKVPVEDVGVVVDEASGDNGSGGGGEKSGGRGTGQAPARQARPQRERHFRSARPEQVRHDHQRRAHEGPVEVEPRERLDEVTVAVHVGVGGVGGGSEAVEVVLEPERGQDEPRDVEQARHQPADELVVHDHLHEETQRRDEQELWQIL